MKPDNTVKQVRGRFAPSPSGRMHLGNIFTAVISWLSVKKQNGQWVLRIEDLDPQRSKPEYAELIEEDLHWLGLDYDEGGLSDQGQCGPYLQSKRGKLYEDAMSRLAEKKLIYPCYCTRGELNAAEAPHGVDGRPLYTGTCRPFLDETVPKPDMPVRSYRIIAPDAEICFQDRLYGRQTVNPARHCGDFIIRRGDGAWAYQLAVVVDDALMGITEVVRGNDLMLSAAQQIYLFNMLGYEPPQYFHLPLLCNKAGKRLSKRDHDLSMETLRKDFSPSGLIGWVGYFAGILPEPFPISAEGLLGLYTPEVIPKTRSVIIDY